MLSEWSSAQDAPVAGRTSSFSTGETWLAFGRLERLFPSNGWREPAELVGRYVMERRDDAEDIYPPTSDHWGAYALDEMQHWSEPPSESLTQLTDAYAERLAGIFGVQVRFESQRTEQSVNVLLRGHQALPAGLGTLGEGLGALWRYEDARGDFGRATPSSSAPHAQPGCSRRARSSPTTHGSTAHGSTPTSRRWTTNSIRCRR